MKQVVISVFLLSTVGSIHLSQGALPLMQEGKSPAVPQLKVTLEATNASYTPDKPVEVWITVTNLSNHEIREGRVPNGGDPSLDVAVHNAAGMLLAEKKPDQSPCGHHPNCEILRMHSGSMVDWGIPAGKSHREKLNLSELYDLSHPGNYTVQASKGISQGVTLMSNVITITITP